MRVAVLLLSVRFGVHAQGPCAYPAVLEADDLTQHCCDGQRLWQEIEASGGCGGSSDGSADRCDMAETICAECSEGLAAASTARRLQALGDDNATAPAEGLALSALAVADLELRCTTTRIVHSRCELRDVALVVIFFAGLSLLVISACGVAAFDRGPLPAYLRRTVRRLAGPAGRPIRPQPPKLLAVEAAPPPFDEPPDKPPDKAPENLMFNLCDVDVMSTCSGEVSNDQDALRATAVAEHELSLAWDLRHALEPSPPELPPEDLPMSRGRPATADSTGSSLVISAAKAPRPKSAAGSDVSTAASDGDGFGDSLRRSAPPMLTTMPPLPVKPSDGYWPRRLARVLALRMGFLFVAGPAAALRIIHVVLCGTVALQRSALAVALESIGCLLPFVWCAVTSRPPATPEGGLPDSVSICRVFCIRISRFSFFAACTAALEVYSIVASAKAVAAVSCDESDWFSSWSSVALYCFGVPVAVARSYSAALALQLKDELTHTCRRVMPVSVPDPSARYAVQTPVNKGIRGSGETQRPGGRRPPALDDFDVTSRPQSQHSVRSYSATPMSCKSSASHFSSGLRRGILPQKRLSCRALLLVGLFLAVVTATGSVWAVRALQPEAAEQDLPSSCAAAQNATATCVPFEYVGENLWDASMGDLLMGTADTEGDCCSGCDELAGCQAWMFESVGRRCRWIRFLEEPCSSNPADLECRCTTHYGTSFGFKPTSQIVWVRRST